MLLLPLPVCLGLERLEDGGPQQRQGERVHYILRLLPPHSSAPQVSLEPRTKKPASCSPPHLHKLAS